MRWTPLVLLMIAGAIRAVVACNGDDSSTNPPDTGPDVSLTGTAGHACFANMTCKSGLTCSSGVCVESEGGLDAAQEAAPTCDADIVAITNECTNMGAAGTFCVVGSQWVCDPPNMPDGSCAGVTPTFACASNFDCVGVCCLSATTFTTTSCPWTTTMPVGTLCTDMDICPTNSFQTCATTGQCQTGLTCHPVTFDVGGALGTETLGVCSP